MTASPIDMRLADSPLRRALRYPRFTRPAPSVLVLDGHYHLHRECVTALRRLGCEVIPVKVGATVRDTVRPLLLALVERRPDFILSINHIGFDDEGWLAGVLEEAELPIAVWYVDSPIFILNGRPFPAPRVTSLFLWERTLIPEMRRLGAEDLHFLPLATDAQAFSRPFRPALRPLSFVGDSMQHAQHKWRDRLGEEAQRRAHVLADRLLACERLDDLLVERSLCPSSSPGPWWDVYALATYSATAAYRLRLLRAVAPDLHVFGDAGWHPLLPQASCHEPVPYGPALADVYASSAITLNATSLQMPTAVNQRVFDAPVAGSFLLTDDREDLHEHFRVGTEVVAYRHPEALAELVRHFLPRELARRAIVARARARVLGEHTYEHRLSRLVGVMIRRHRVLGRPLPAIADPVEVAR
jgi:spore maturation protein CgeB